MAMTLRSGTVLGRVNRGRVCKRAAVVVVKARPSSSSRRPLISKQQSPSCCSPVAACVVDAATQTAQTGVAAAAAGPAPRPAATTTAPLGTVVSNRRGTVTVLADPTMASLMQSHLMLASMQIAKPIKAFASTFRLSLSAQDMSTTILRCILDCCSTQEVSAAEQAILARLQQPSNGGSSSSSSSSSSSHQQVTVTMGRQALRQLLADVCSPTISRDAAITAMSNLAHKGHIIILEDQH